MCVFFPALANVPNLGGRVKAEKIFKQIYTPLYPLKYPGGLEIAWIIQSQGLSVITLQVNLKISTNIVIQSIQFLL